MKKLNLIATFLFLAVVSISSLGNCATVTLSLAKSDDPSVVRYEIRYGTNSGIYTHTKSIDSAESRIVQIDSLDEGVKYFFVAVSFNNLGVESNFSEEISTTVSPSIGGTFSDTTDTVSWNSDVYYIGGGATISFIEGEEFTDGGALMISGGQYQAAKVSFYSDTFEIGEQIFVNGRVKIANFQSNPAIYIRANGINKTNWTQTSFEGNGQSQLFVLPVTLTADDLDGIDINVFLFDSSAVMYLDDIYISRGGNQITSLIKRPVLHYSTDLSAVSDWDSNVFYIGGGATIERDVILSQPEYSVKAFGGIHQALRKTIYGLVLGDEIIIHGEMKSKNGNTIYVRTNGTNKTNWTQEAIPNNGTFEHFYFQSTVTADDIDGFDINAFVIGDSGDELFLKDVSVYTLTTVKYSTDFTLVGDWNPNVYYVGGGATIERNTILSEETYAVKASRGTHQALRKTIYGLTANHNVIISGQFKSDSIGSVYFRTNTNNQTNWNEKFIDSNGDFQDFYIATKVTSADAENGLDFNAVVFSEPNATLWLRNVRVDVLQNDDWKKDPTYIGGNTTITLMRNSFFGGDGFGLEFKNGNFQAGFVRIFGIPTGFSFNANFRFKSNSISPIYFRTHPVNRVDQWNQDSTLPTGSLEGFELPVTTTEESCYYGLDISVFAPEPSPTTLFLESVTLNTIE